MDELNVSSWPIPAYRTAAWTYRKAKGVIDAYTAWIKSEPRARYLGNLVVPLLAIRIGPGARATSGPRLGEDDKKIPYR
jgi:hypothetical protein